jgi:hypothetical protein
VSGAFAETCQEAFGAFQEGGRIERLWGTFQDRLVSELRVAGAQTIIQASQVLADFLPRYNQRFMVPAAQP